ncbi:hypothetical protein OS128_10085 [Corynebacterium sp. P5848]|uniref:hypothetical protein n=1 Tax=Corynebacterium marambiense TaxID=2765364 RepID=UPI002260C295|nr:hypothetical protein [Corynebacterium marambiense]MCX7543261.1 hypothetical protein [Corynebacterium marambiense]
MRAASTAAAAAVCYPANPPMVTTLTRSRNCRSQAPDQPVKAFAQRTWTMSPADRPTRYPSTTGVKVHQNGGERAAALPANLCSSTPSTRPPFKVMPIVVDQIPHGFDCEAVNQGPTHTECCYEDRGKTLARSTAEPLQDPPRAPAGNRGPRFCRKR